MIESREGIWMAPISGDASLPFSFFTQGFTARGAYLLSPPLTPNLIGEEEETKCEL